MNKLVEAALANLKKAVAGQPVGSYCQFAAGDVAEVGKYIATHDDATKILADSVKDLRPSAECHAWTHTVAHLIEVAEAQAAG